MRVIGIWEFGTTEREWVDRGVWTRDEKVQKGKMLDFLF